METFEIELQIETQSFKIFVIPFEIPGDEDVAGYLIVKDDITLGSIKLDTGSRWATEDDLPWNDSELQLIGDQIAYHFLLCVF
jgi:hypothetical protein